MAAFPRRARLWSTWLWTLGLSAVVAAGATAAAVIGGKGGLELVFAILALAALMLPYLASLTTSFRHDAEIALFKSHPVAGLAKMVAFFVAVYLVYAFGTHCFDPIAMLKVVTFVTVPSVLVAWAGRGQRVAWQDWVAVACIWIPFDFSLLNAIWEWPEGQAGYILSTPLAVDLALLLFVGFRRYDMVKFRWRLNARELLTVLAALVGFMILALPFGLGTGFIAFHPRLDDVAKLIGTPLGILFFIAIPEELLFRGLIQNMLQKRLNRQVAGLLLAALFFGATHLNNTDPPDWRYFVLATLAGIFYGWTYMRSRSLVASALLHTMVDTIWALLLTP